MDYNVTTQKIYKKNMWTLFESLVQVKPRFEEGGIRAIVDRKMDMGYNEALFTDMTNLALRCVEHDRFQRPSMKVCASLLIG